MTKAQTKELFDGEPEVKTKTKVKEHSGTTLDDSIPESADLAAIEVTAPKEEVETTAIRPISFQSTKHAIEEARKRTLERAEAEAALRQAALGFTTHNDWIFHEVEGELIPYLEETGSEKLMHAFGIELEIDKVVLEDYREQSGESDDFEVVTYGRVRAQVFSSVWYPVVGSRWAGDGFFSRAGQIRVDPGDVRKASYASVYNRGIKKVLGLRGVTKEDLDRVPSINVSKIRTVSHREKRPGGPNGDGGKAIAEILAAKHVAVFVPYEDVTNRARVKTMKGSRFHKAPHPILKKPNVWIAPYTPQAESLAADLAADNQKINWRVVDPAKPEG